MAEGLPTPKSREQLFSEMLTEYVGLTGIDDLNTGSGVTQFFDVIARSVARTSGDIFQILRDFSLERATDEALNRIGEEERVSRITAQVASGVVKVTDTSFEKIATKIFSGGGAVNINSTVIKVSDASNFPSSGTIYIGRNTPNIEGPINYTSVSQVGSYWEINLATSTNKFHNENETVILGQGGTRTIPVGTVVLSPGVGATADVNYTTSAEAIILDGENVNANVQVVAQEPGSFANAPIGAIREFSIEPFPGAAVVNDLPFTNGSDSESDDDYRDRIKKERLSKGLGTALAVKNAVLGAQAPDEDARVTSNEIDTTNPEETILYIDNGEAYEEISEGVGIESIVDSAIGGEQNFQLATGGNQTSVRKAFLESSTSSPFSVNAFDTLSVLVGGVISEHTFLSGDFKANGSATAYEIVASINNNTDLTFEASTAEGGTKVVIQAKAEENEFLQMTTPTSGTDANDALGFASNEVSTLFLYKNNELLNKNGRSAFVISKEQFDWSNSITDGDTLIVSVDGTAAITYTFTNQDFISEGQHTIVSNQNSLSSWVNVINEKVTGVTAEVNGEQIKLTSNLGSSDRASISIDPTSTLVLKGMFTTELGLSAQGNESDFDFSRNTAQIKLKTPLSNGDKLQMGSEFTRAEIQSSEILGGQVTISSTAYLWLLVDDVEASAVSIGVTSSTFLTVSKPGSEIVRYESSVANAFDNVEVGDYLIVWSEELSAGNRLEGRVNAKTSTTLDLKVTSTEEASAVAEGPISFGEGFTVIRSTHSPQKIKIDAGVYDINTVASLMNDQLDNATVSIDNDEVIILRSNTESTDGGLFLVEISEFAKAFNFTKNTKTQSISSQLAFYETSFKDKQFPEFIHGKINTEQFADPPTSYLNSIDSSENLETLGIDPSGFICFSNPYGSSSDALTNECVEIQNFVGTTIEVENSNFYRRSRANDRYHVINGYDFGHNDSLVVVLDNDPTDKTFDMPLYRTAVTNITHPTNPDNFRAYDLEGGSSIEFTEFFGNDFLFDNYKALMQAKNGLDPLSATDEDAILYRSSEWGRSGEKIGVGYYYPTSPSQPISSVVTVNENVDIKIFLKSGPARTTTIDGTTEWNVSISPLNPSVDLVTYTHSGTGTIPGLGSVNAGDYVAISNTGEFDEKNIGNYRVESSTATSFTIRRANGDAITQTNVATLETSTLTFFEKNDTTAQEIVDYVTNNLSDYMSATILNDNGLTGAGIIDKSTLEDSDFSYELVRLLDGKNYILSSDLDATVGNPQFTFKDSLQLDSFSTNTVDAYSFNNGEQVKLVPITSLQLTNFLQILAVTGFTTLGSIKSVDRNSNLQLATNTVGSEGAIEIAGGSANSSGASVDGSAFLVGNQDSYKSVISIPAASSLGLHSDQWVKVSATEVQKKITSIASGNSIEITSSTPSAGFAKVQITDRGVEQRLFGRNRYHTRTRGRTFKIEKQGQFACISWDENGTQPYFLKNSIELKDSSASTLTILKNELTGIVDVSVDSGDMRFDEVYFGDLVTLTNRLNSENNGTFVVLGKSTDGKTLRISNRNAINELATGSFTITDNVAVLGSSFTIGASTLVEGTDFNAGVDVNETALNLAAAIGLLPNLSSESSGAVVNIESQVTGVTVAISVAGGGATASGSELSAPTSNTGDISVVSDVKEGDSLTISSDFNVLNQGSFRVVRRFNNSVYIENLNAIEEEVTLADQFVSTGYSGTTEFDIEKLDGVTRLKWNGNGTQPSFDDLRPGDTIILGTDFASANQGEYHILDAGIDGGLDYVDYINVNGSNETGITISDVLNFHREAMKFKKYEGTIPGDVFVISSDFLGNQNEGRFVVSEVLSEEEIIVVGEMTTTGVTLLDSDFSKVYIEEEKAYSGFKKIDFIITNPANSNSKNVAFDSAYQYEKINEIGGVTIQAVSKLSFPSNVVFGIDSYQFNTGLIGEVNRIVYGDPRDNTTYPGVGAAGAEIFIKAPLVKRIQVSISVRVKTGIPFVTLVEEIRNSVAALIKSNPVGQSIAISDIVSNVNAIIGVQAVAIDSPQYDSQNDVIRINAREKAFILDAISDIIVSKID